MKKGLILPFLIMGMLVGAGLFFNDQDVSPVNAQTATTTTPRITIDEPDQNDLVSSPLAVSGTATGNWFFEATAPVKVYNSNGAKVGEGIITAQGDWMTTSTVPFTGNISFSAPATATGLVVFERSNPSGLAENATSSSVLVRFTNTTTTIPGTPNTGGRMFWFLNLDWWN